MGRFLHPDQVNAEGATSSGARHEGTPHKKPGEDPKRSPKRVAPASERRVRDHPAPLGLGEEPLAFNTSRSPVRVPGAFNLSPPKAHLASVRRAGSPPSEEEQEARGGWIGWR